MKGSIHFRCFLWGVTTLFPLEFFFSPQISFESRRALPLLLLLNLRLVVLPPGVQGEGEASLQGEAEVELSTFGVQSVPGKNPGTG